MSGADRVLFAGRHLRASLWQPAPPRDPRPESTGLVVTFDHYRPGRSGFETPRPSASFDRRGLAQLIIQSAGNDWFVNADTAALAEALRPVAAGFGKVTLLGFSMGGYGALRFAGALGAQRAVLVSPQISISASQAPFEHRYRAEAAAFDEALGDLERAEVPAGLRGVLAFDPFIAADLAHARRIEALCPGLRLARLGFGGHPAIQTLRDGGQQGVALRLAMRDEPRAAELIAAHRAARRGAAGYWRRLARRAAGRWPDLAAMAGWRAEALSEAAGSR